MQVQVKTNVLAKMMPLQSPYNSCLRKKIYLYLNLLGSPGAGKTSLLEATLQDLKKSYRLSCY